MFARSEKSLHLLEAAQRQYRAVRNRAVLVLTQIQPPLHAERQNF